MSIFSGFKIDIFHTSIVGTILSVRDETEILIVFALNIIGPVNAHGIFIVNRTSESLCLRVFL